MRTDRHLRCERCPASMPTRTATLTASSILCPACAALLPLPPSITPTGPLGGDAPERAGPSPSTLLQKSTAGQ